MCCTGIELMVMAVKHQDRECSIAEDNRNCQFLLSKAGDDGARVRANKC